MSAALIERQRIKYRNKGTADQSRGILQPASAFSLEADAAAYYAAWEEQAERRRVLREAMPRTCHDLLPGDSFR